MKRKTHNKFAVRRVRKLSDQQVDRLKSEGGAKGSSKKRQKSLAKKYGVSQAFVSKVLSGKSRKAKHRGQKNIPKRR